MKTIKYIFASLVVGISLAGCQDKDIDKSAPKLAPIEESAISGNLQGNDYVWTWSGTSG